MISLFWIFKFQKVHNMVHNINSTYHNLHCKVPWHVW